MTRVLVVDDEPQIVRALAINLRARGYDVHTAASGAEALQVAAAHPPDLVILDLGLPDMDGSDVIAGLRGWTTVPILVLSGRSDSADKVDALDAGADDYVIKPFGMDELLVRAVVVGPQQAMAAHRGAVLHEPVVLAAIHAVVVQVLINRRRDVAAVGEVHREESPQVQERGAGLDRRRDRVVILGALALDE